MKTTIKIGLAEDHGALRQGYVSLLKMDKKFDVLFDVSNGRQLLQKLKLLKPNIVLLDLAMPEMSGKQVLEVLRLKYPSIKVIIVSAYFTKANIVESFKLGAKAFLKKEYNIEKIMEAIMQTHVSGAYIDNEVASIVVEQLSNGDRKPKLELNDHQIVVLKLLCQGYSVKQAAEELGVTQSGIKFHRANIMRITGATNMQELMVYAKRKKLI